MALRAIKNIFLVTVLLLFLPLVMQARDDTLVMPQYPGGPEAMMAFIEDHTIISMAEDIDRNAEYSVSVYFTVNTSGQIHHLNIQNVPEPVSDSFHRCFVQMPDWKPGMKQGKPVDTYMQVRFHFVVNGNRIHITWVDEFRSTVHQEGGGALKLALIGGAIALMLVLLAL